MTFREVTVARVQEALRRWLRGEGERIIAKVIEIDRKTARRGRKDVLGDRVRTHRGSQK